MHHLSVDGADVCLVPILQNRTEKVRLTVICIASLAYIPNLAVRIVPALCRTIREDGHTARVQQDCRGFLILHNTRLLPSKDGRVEPYIVAIGLVEGDVRRPGM